MLSALYYTKGVSIPVAFELITKPEIIAENGKRQRVSEKTKNELLRAMLDVNVRNQLKFRYTLFDSWFASQETFEHIVNYQNH